MEHADAHPRGFGQQRREEQVLRGVDDDGGPRHRGDRTIERTEELAVIVKVPSQLSPPVRQEEVAKELPPLGDSLLRVLQAVQVQVGTASGQIVQYEPPEPALADCGPAAAEITVVHPAAEDPHQLTGAEESVDRTECSTEKGAAAPAHAGDVEDVHVLLGVGGGCTASGGQSWISCGVGPFDQRVHSPASCFTEHPTCS